MIYCYTGTPGSGKSFHVIKDIVFKLKRGGNVISNFPIKLNDIKRVKGDFQYLQNNDLTVKYLVEYAQKKHIRGKEHQTTLVIDEAQNIFNCRDFRLADRKDFIEFFSLHRHLGFDVILVTQNIRFLDKQIRMLIEYDLCHRIVNNYKFFGKICPVKMFAVVTKWVVNNEKISIDFLMFDKRLSMLYDSYALFDTGKHTESPSPSVVDGVGAPIVDDRVRAVSILSRIPFLRFLVASD